MKYEVNPKYYLEGASPEEMLATDLENAKEDICSFLDIFPHQITGKIIQ